MDKPKYTAGPWKVLNPQGDQGIYTGNGTLLAEIAGDSNIARANAALIVASPDMFDILSRLATDEFREQCPSWHEDIVKILEKARGEL